MVRAFNSPLPPTPFLSPESQPRTTRPTRDEVSASGLDTLLSVAAAAAVAAVPTLPGLASPSLPQLGDRLLTHGSTLLVALSGDAAAAYAPPNPRSGDTRDDKVRLLLRSPSSISSTMDTYNPLPSERLHMTPRLGWMS